MEEFGFTPEHVAARARQLVGRPTVRPAPRCRAHRCPRRPKGHAVTTLNDLYDQQGQSPWLDNLRRDWLQNGTMAGLVAQGHPGGDLQPHHLRQGHRRPGHLRRPVRSLIKTKSVEDAYWDLVVDDINAALAILRPVYDSSDGGDGYVSVEVAPSLAHDTEGTISAARSLHQRIDQPNAAGQDPRHRRVRPGHPPDDQRGAQHQRDPHLQPRPATARSSRPTSPGSRPWSPPAPRTSPTWPAWPPSSSAGSTPRSTGASSRGPLDGPDGRATSSSRGKAAVAQGRLAYRLFTERFSGPRWEALAAAGARVQRPLWASTSTKNPDYPDLALCGHADRPGHGQHHARRHRRRLPRPRHGGPHRRHRLRRVPST